MMTTETRAAAASPQAVAAAAEAAVRAVPPVWPLASSVAVNPFLGQTGEDLATCGARLARVGGVPITMPRNWYAERIADGRIADEDIAAALAAAPARRVPADVAAVKAAAEAPEPAAEPVPTVADLAAAATGTDWPGLISERMGAWCAAFFDEGQALWAAPREKGAWAEWRSVATHDLTPEIAGLKGFAAHVADTPQDAGAAIARAVTRLGVPEAALETYFHALLMSLGGWAQVGRYRLWQAELGGDTDTTATELLAIRLVWEEALLGLCGQQIAEGWAEARAAHAAPVEATEDLALDAVLQEAAERAAQRDLATQIGGQHAEMTGRPALQAAFCIDVRSEVFRRALESLDPKISTLGFAGFFGLGTAHRRFASDVEELRLPVLLNPGVSTSATGPEQAEADASARFTARALRAWGRFKLAAVSSFAFVEAMGPVYVMKLVRDALGLEERAAAPNDPAPKLDPALDLESRIGAAETVLRAMSLTEGFARLVILAGHGANVTNNPHASALHCGACGGYSGEVNARLLAGLLNDAEVRAGLVSRGIEIPEDTLFVGALHDTTTDAVTLYTADCPSEPHREDIGQARKWLEGAGRLARAERALRLPRAEGASDIPQRARDWAEVRPEWALAGARAFVAAPRSRTAGTSLGGRAFLHDYDWKADRDFSVLELIMTAPVVVASWISLQYYGSTVAPQTFGGGNKLLHNIAGGIGVVEGNGGPLRVGLPWQSVHDGEDFVHEPLRLSVCIEAPREAMSDILKRHEGVRALFDNRWLHLFALDAEGRMAWRYAGDLIWEPIEAVPAEAAEPALAAAG